MASEDRAPSRASRRTLSLLGFASCPPNDCFKEACAACISLVAVKSRIRGTPLA